MVCTIDSWFIILVCHTDVRCWWTKQINVFTYSHWQTDRHDNINGQSMNRALMPMLPPPVPAHRLPPAPLDSKAEAVARQRLLLLRTPTFKLKQHLEYLKDPAKAAWLVACRCCRRRWLGNWGRLSISAFMGWLCRASPGYAVLLYAGLESIRLTLTLFTVLLITVTKMARQPRLHHDIMQPLHISVCFQWNAYTHETYISLQPLGASTHFCASI